MKDYYRTTSWWQPHGVGWTKFGIPKEKIDFDKSALTYSPGHYFLSSHFWVESKNFRKELFHRLFNYHSRVHLCRHHFKDITITIFLFLLFLKLWIIQKEENKTGGILQLLKNFSPARINTKTPKKRKKGRKGSLAGEIKFSASALYSHQSHAEFFLSFGVISSSKLLTRKKILWGPKIVQKFFIFYFLNPEERKMW